MRTLPGRPSLRYLKVEAKRRLSAGEFPALHEAQLAIAREHGLPSWTALKQFIDSQPRRAGHAAQQLRWVISRFGGADDPAWVAPADGELREHFDEGFLSAVAPDRLTAMLASRAVLMREELVVTYDMPLHVQAQIAGLRIQASVEAGPPHRFTGLRFRRLGSRITDARVAAPATRTSGEVPAAAAEAADRAFAELGLVGLALAGGTSGSAWTAVRGWADLDRAAVLRTGHRFPAYQITKLITTIAVLRLIAGGRVGLGDPANGHLRSVRLADDAVTIRELLTHTGGVDSPAGEFADTVPDLVSLAGTLGRVPARPPP